jgi:Methyltransferase domain
MFGRGLGRRLPIYWRTRIRRLLEKGGVKTKAKPADVFGHVYRYRLWGGDTQDFYSGNGSHAPELVEPYIAAVRDFLSAFPAPPVVVDIGCGDFSVGVRLVDLAQSYIGCDVVQELIARNREMFARDNLEFRWLDAITEPLPPGDVVVLRQVLQHLRNDQIKSIITKLGQYRTWIICDHLPLGEFTPNLDKVMDGWTRLPFDSGVVLLEKPFKVKPRGTQLLCEVGSEGGVIRTLAYTF